MKFQSRAASLHGQKRDVNYIFVEKNVDEVIPYKRLYDNANKEGVYASLLANNLLGRKFVNFSEYIFQNIAVGHMQRWCNTIRICKSMSIIFAPECTPEHARAYRKIFLTNLNLASLH